MFDTKYNVLLIDDESNSVTSFQALLQNKNYLPLLLTDPTNIQQPPPKLGWRSALQYQINQSLRIKCIKRDYAIG